MTGEKALAAAAGSKGLEQLAQGAGRAVLSSSQGEQRSYIRSDRKMSIFTYHLIEALTGHAQPAEGATEVLVSDVMGHVWRRCHRAPVRTPAGPAAGLPGQRQLPCGAAVGWQGLEQGCDAARPAAAAAGRVVYRLANHGRGRRPGGSRSDDPRRSGVGGQD